MASYLPFINGKTDHKILKEYYSDADIVRMPLKWLISDTRIPPRGGKKWIDAGLDGYDHIIKGNAPWADWSDYIKTFDEWESMGDSAFIQKPDVDKVKVFVNDVLDKCKEKGADWITIPQLPVTDDNSRNAINKKLAKATGEWKALKEYTGKLILPLTFTHKDQLKGKTEWKKKLKVAQKCYHEAKSFGIWVVDSSLADQEGKGTFGKRFASLISFHEDVREYFPNAKIIAGPYWGINLVLWVRQLCDYPAISLGSGYRYQLSGGFMNKGNTRVAIPPLRRWATASPELKNWLDLSLQQLAPTDPAYSDLKKLSTGFESLMSNRELAKKQVAKFYKNWFDEIELIPKDGRTLGLYQDLSSAYVLGKKLQSLPSTERTAKKAEKVAEQLMLNCL